MTLDEWSSLDDFELCGWSSRQDEEGRRVGTTLWASTEGGGRVGLAWEWCEISRDVFLMSDPMSVLSNVALHGIEDRANDFKRTIELNNTVYGLPWQAALRRLARPKARARVEPAEALA